MRSSGLLRVADPRSDVALNFGQHAPSGFLVLIITNVTHVVTRADHPFIPSFLHPNKKGAPKRALNLYEQ